MLGAKLNSTAVPSIYVPLYCLYSDFFCALVTFGLCGGHVFAPTPRQYPKLYSGAVGFFVVYTILLITTGCRVSRKGGCVGTAECWAFCDWRKAGSHLLESGDGARVSSSRCLCGTPTLCSSNYSIFLCLTLHSLVEFVCAVSKRC